MLALVLVIQDGLDPLVILLIVDQITAIRTILEELVFLILLVIAIPSDTTVPIVQFLDALNLRVLSIRLALLPINACVFPTLSMPSAH